MFLFLWTSLFFGYSFNEAYHTSEFWFIQRISFFFSLWILCAALFWNLGFFHIPNYVLGFSTNKRQLLMRVRPLRNKQKFIMCPHPLTTTWQLNHFYSFKIHHMLAFFFSCFFLSTNHSHRFASPLTHTWLIEIEVFPCLSHHVMIERGEGETDSPTSTILSFLLSIIVH